jgi:hypothetical protein
VVIGIVIVVIVLIGIGVLAALGERQDRLRTTPRASARGRPVKVGTTRRAAPVEPEGHRMSAADLSSPP